MKKLMILAAAVAAMAACTKSEVVYDDNDVEIALAPVNYMTTKMQYGPQGGESGTEYSASEEFNIFAEYTASDAGTELLSATGTTRYLNDVRFKKHTEQVSGRYVWTGYPSAYYWPKTGSLYFAGYSPADAVKKSATYEFSPDDPKLSITEFTQGNYVYEYEDGKPDNGTEGYSMVDLMYFDVYSTTQSTGSASLYHEATFRHALSYITFKIKSTATAQKLYKITNISLNNINQSGDFVSGSNPSWTTTWNPKSHDLYKDSKIVDQNEFLIDNILLIPQDIPSNVLQIEYEQRASTDSNVPFVKQVTFQQTLTGGTGTTETDKWLINKHYVYNITFDATEIKIAPDVFSWDNVNESNIDTTIK